MRQPETNRFFELIAKERNARDKSFEWLRTSLLSVGSSMAGLAIAHSEKFLGISQEMAKVSEDLAYTGACVGIGAVAITGFNTLRYLTASDSLQVLQSKSFQTMRTSNDGRELTDVTPLIIQIERPGEPTEGWV